MSFLLCGLIFRIVIPILIITCIIFRPCALSALYLILLLLMPWVPIPSPTSMKGITGVFLKFLIAFSILTFVLQLAFQIVLFALPPYAHFVKDCEFLEKLLRHIGLIRLNDLDSVSIIQWLSPEIVMLITSVAGYIGLKRLTSLELVPTDDIQPERPKKKKFTFLVTIGRYVSLASLCFTAVLRPSIPGGFYFLVFLSAATWWGCYKELNKAYAVVLRLVLVVLVVHIGVLYAAQFQWFQEVLPNNGTYSRLFGLTQLGRVDCDSDPRVFITYDLEWASFVNPLALIWLYYIIVVESKQLLSAQLQTKQGAFSRLEGSFNGPLSRQLSHRLSDRSKLKRSATTRKRWQNATRKVHLIRGVSQSKIYGSSLKSRGLYQDPTGSVTITGSDDIAMHQLDSLEEEEDKPSCVDHFLLFLESLFQFITKSSYIATNIIMMAWSITYHSWLTFVLLLWANLLWMVPNQRRSMLRSSPFLVFYAWFLLISAYIYSMDLTEEELPSKIQDVNLGQIGFVKITLLPCNPLLVKCLYTTMFWITLRQFMQERQEAKQKSTLADMVAPLQVTVGTATGISQEEEEKGSPILKKIGLIVKKFLTKFWIWVVAITLFAVAITGQRMTIFRIIYMALFLFFILCFQISFRVWRKIMFGFWLTVIIYSMMILILVYTYQFDNFPQYWEDYLHVGKDQQLDIGLEIYETKMLFVRLVTPTFFVIVTVIQLHYFHKDFMIMTNPDQLYHGDSERTDATSAQGGAPTTITDSERTDKTETQQNDTTKTPPETTKFWSKSTAIKLKFTLEQYMNLTYLFLELHMPKIVLLIGFLVCTYDKCSIYLIFMVLIVFGVFTRRKAQSIAIYSSSVLISIMLLLRMIYQIQYVQIVYVHTMNMTCENETKVNVTNKNAEWMGFYKVEDKITLPYLVRWNIIYIIVVCLWSVILVRQSNYRLSRGKSGKRPFFMFPRLKRADADVNIKNFIKYLFNYGYYKFGVEICLIATVALIGFRMDFYSILYSLWLLGLFALNRKTLASIWNFYLAFIGVFLVLQYIMVIGVPRGFCVQFPWGDSDVLRRLQEWGFLMDYDYPPPPKKLVCDFLLLMFVSRQSIVFRIEKRFAALNYEYPGGSNDSIIHLAEEDNFVNPVPDFVTYIRSYLDALKRCVLLTFLWITLAVVFLAGTNRVNVFSIGYLIGSFVFLWQGTDLYLRPIPHILRSWNWLLGYNVSIILMKSVLQLVGCIFIKDVQEHACWLVQVLGIGCVRKFNNAVIAAGLSEPNSCSVPREYIGLAWDGVCFGMLLTQRRIFTSYNFFHMIDEIKATSILASRGAELIGELRHKQMAEQEDTEKRIIEKIRTKMERIKANQQRIQGPAYRDTNNHYIDQIYPSQRPLYRKQTPKTYKQAIRSGDYYMFDEMDDEELDIFEETKVEDEEEEEEEQRHKKRTVGQIHEHPQDEKDPDDDPKPGTSKQDDISQLDDHTETPHQKETIKQKLWSYFLFAWAFIEGIMVTIINFLNKHSKDYRYVMKVLTIEKKLLKESTTYNKGIRPGRSGIWHPLGSYHTLIQQARDEKLSATHTGSASSIHDTTEKTDTKAIATSLPTTKPYDSDESLESQSHALQYDTEELSSLDQPTIIRLVLAIWYIIMSHSDLMCYFIIFLNQIKSATFLSLPLPLMVFYWGSMTIPRPSKTFWVTIIAYTEIIVLVKCMFQFEILPWNQNPNVVNPFYPPKIIGIERKKDYAVWDLLVLLIVFFHRFMLKSLGLWKVTYTSSSKQLRDGDYIVQGGNYIPVDTQLPRWQKSRYKKTKIGKMPKKMQTSVMDLFFSKKKKKKFQNKLAENSNNTSSQSKEKDSDEHSDLQKLVEEPEELQDDAQKSTLTISGESEKRIVSVRTDTVPVIALYPNVLKVTATKYLENISKFFKHLLDPTSRVAADVYSYMFLCDFYNFFVILLGYSSFGTQQGDGGVTSYLEDNRIPILFLLMLILQFMLIIIDRAIYLRRYIFGKVIFQFLQIFILHIWLFVLFPLMTERSFNSVVAPQMYYMVKCFYLLLSAYQIRCGYPTRILGNFLCKGYNYLNMGLFKAFMIIPFLFELRNVMDWMWTDTSMTIFDWIKMEDIFAHIFMLKCTRHVEDEYPQPRGEKKSVVIKYLMGGICLFVIIAIIWFPMVFFSLGNTVGQANVPYDITVDLRIGPYEPIYQMTAQSNAIYSFNEREFNSLMSVYRKEKAALTFISNYEAADIAAVQLSYDSSRVWGISPPDRKRMEEEIQSNHPLTIHLTYVVRHHSNSKEDSGIIREGVEVILPAFIAGKRNPDREKLYEMLAYGTMSPGVVLQYIFPKFIKVTNRGTAKTVLSLMQGAGKYPSDKASSYRNITIKLNKKPLEGSSLTMEREWWDIRENYGDYNYEHYLDKIPHQNVDNITIFTFNDKIFPATLSVLTGGGIIKFLGVYLAITMSFWRILKYMQNQLYNNWWYNIMNIDRLHNLIYNLYLARNLKMYELEEYLMAHLVFLLRSNELLIRYSRPKDLTPEMRRQLKKYHPRYWERK